MALFRRSQLSERQERAVQRTLQQMRQQRRQRFRLLACIDGGCLEYVGAIETPIELEIGNGILGKVGTNLLAATRLGKEITSAAAGFSTGRPLRR